MTTAQPQLQIAIYERLTEDSSLMALVTDVYDEVAKGASAPYIVIGEVTEEPVEAHDRSGLTATVILNIWSRYRGYRESSLIMTEMDRLLHRPSPALNVDGFQKVSIAQEQHQFTRDPDPDLRRVIVRYRVWLEEPAPVTNEEMV